jgi:uncharacterized protein HemX
MMKVITKERRYHIMWRSKKFIIIALLAVVVLAGSIGGVVFAQTENEEDNSPATQQAALLEKVATIYEENTGVAIDPDQLKAAFKQAGQEMQDAALDKYLSGLVDEGKITQEQAQEYKDWLKAKPDVPALPGLGGSGGHRGFGMFGGGFPRWGGPTSAPETTEQ